MKTRRLKPVVIADEEAEDIPLLRSWVEEYCEATASDETLCVLWRLHCCQRYRCPAWLTPKASDDLFDVVELFAKGTIE